MVNINDRCISRDWQPWLITYRDYGILSFAKIILAFTIYVTWCTYTHTHTHTHTHTDGVTKILKFMMLFHINCLRESSYTFNVIYFRAQKFISRLDVLVVYLSRTLVIFIASSLHVFEARNRSIVFRIIWLWHTLIICPWYGSST